MCYHGKKNVTHKHTYRQTLEEFNIDNNDDNQMTHDNLIKDIEHQMELRKILGEFQYRTSLAQLKISPGMNNVFQIS